MHRANSGTSVAKHRCLRVVWALLWVLICVQFVGANMSLWRVDQAADYLGIRPKTLYEWVRTGRVPYRKLGFNVRFDPAELEAWVGEQRSVEPEGKAAELEAASRAAARHLRRLETDLGEHLSFPQRRELRELAARLERAAVEAQ